MFDEGVFIDHLYEMGAVRFGEFTLRSGAVSPIYIDLRMLISRPAMVRDAGVALFEKTRGCDYDLVSGVPYAALPIATALSISYDIPMIIKRKEVKAYGTRKEIEGAFCEGDVCLVIDDLITSGTSVTEVLEGLERGGVVVKDVAVIIDRKQGGVARLVERGHTVHALFTLPDLVDRLEGRGKIDAGTASRVREYLQLCPG
ncbi:MAG: orotate phosphoribosyltransferase [Simkaniaceae bacterium]|nr:orotate phosphoribosyltransferase [Simkaniaceae bacterium]